MADCEECGYTTSPYGEDWKFWKHEPHRKVKLVWQCTDCRDSKVVEPMTAPAPWRPGAAAFGSAGGLLVLLTGLIELLAHTL